MVIILLSVNIMVFLASDILELFKRYHPFYW